MPRRLVSLLLILTVGAAGCASCRSVDLPDPGESAVLNIEVNDIVTVITRDGTRFDGQVKAVDPGQITIVENLYRNREETVFAVADIETITVQESNPIAWVVTTVVALTAVAAVALIVWSSMWSGVSLA